jgi:hypothetical protein
MAHTFSPNTVTDGLIFYVDAANPRSYISGSTTTYSLNNQYTGSLKNGADFTTSSFGCWELDGIDDYINCGDGSTPSFTSSLDPQLNNFTVNCFFDINPGFGPTDQGILISKGNHGSANIGWTMHYTANYSSIGVRCNGDNTTSQRAGQGLSFPLASSTGSAHMLTMVIDRTNDKILGYHNGSNDNFTPGHSGATSDDISGFGSIISPSALKIGRGSGFADWFGNIYLAQIYNRALSADEVQQNYNALKNRFT